MPRPRKITNKQKHLWIQSNSIKIDQFVFMHRALEQQNRFFWQWVQHGYKKETNNKMQWIFALLKVCKLGLSIFYLAWFPGAILRTFPTGGAEWGTSLYFFQVWEFSNPYLFCSTCTVHCSSKTQLFVPGWLGSARDIVLVTNFSPCSQSPNNRTSIHIGMWFFHKTCIWWLKISALSHYNTQKPCMNNTDINK